MSVLKKRRKNDSILKALKNQEAFIEHGLKIFQDAEINWEKYEREYPEIDFNEIKQDIRKIKGWDSIGYQRILGGFFFDWGIEIVGFFLGALLLPLYILIFIPYPDAEGYYNIANSWFAMLYFYFDIGTRYGLERFIGEYRIKNPQKMLGFLQF
ncbi:MAG: hypothetical protein ACTSWN_06375, partial [Promethearchaeota archaeon]